MTKRIQSAMTALAMVCAITLLAFSTNGQDREIERRISEVQEQIHATSNKGEELQADGQIEQAQEMFARAEAMSAELHAWIEQLEHDGTDRSRNDRDRNQQDGGHYINVIEHLEHAMMILSEHGNTELSMQIENVADQIRDRVHGRKRGEERKRDEYRDGRQRDRDSLVRGDREHLMYQIEVMRIAVPAIQEAGRMDAAELLEHAIHARELQLEGVRGDEAMHVIESAPDIGVEVEILGRASRLWEEFGNSEKAEIVGELAGELREQAHHLRYELEINRDPELERQHGQDRLEMERQHAQYRLELERQHAQHRLEIERQHGQDRLQELERAIDELSRALEELHMEFEELRRR